MGTGYVATDLDRTLIWSRRRAGVPLEALGDLVCVEVLKEKDHAFVTAKAWSAIEDVAERGVLLPVTTRTPKQVRRIGLPPARHVLCLNGSVLLTDGEVDAVHARQSEALAAQVRPLHEFFGRVAGLAAAPHIRRLREADGVFGYFLLTEDSVPKDWLAELQAVAEEDDWVVTAEQTKIYVMPRTLTKAGGLSRALERLDADLLAAAGDSRLDEGMLRLAPHALAPRGSYLHDHGWDGDLTGATGVLAGEEIALWLLGHSLGQAG